MKKRILDSLIIWGAMLIIGGLSVWMMLLGTQGIDWIFKQLSELKAYYFTPNLPGLAVSGFGIICTCALICYLFASKIGKPYHPAATGPLYAYIDLTLIALLWIFYALCSQHQNLSLIIRGYIWLMVLGGIAVRLEKDCKASYVAFWFIFLLSLNEFFGTYPSLSMSGVKPQEKDFLEHYFGLTQLIMLSHAALLLATPSSFKWIWFDAEKARDEWIRKILGPLEEAAALDNVPKTEDDPSSKQQPNSSP